MIAFFPTPYPDELLFSIFARFHIRSGNVSPKATSEDLFGMRNASAVIDLPNNIDNLVKNLPVNSKHTSEEFIYNHTLLPYYSPFLSESNLDLVLKSMRKNKGGDIHTRAGIMASNIKAPKFLRFCPICYKNDIENNGETYWHRLHQAPGVLVCPDHKVALKNSKNLISKLNKQEFQALKDEDSLHLLSHKIYNDKLLEKLIVIAEDIKWLLCQNILPQKTGYQEKYINLLKEKGYATSNGRVAQKELIDAFVNYYGEEFLEEVQSMVEYGEYNWLSNIVRKHRKSFHPIRHLLMIRFLSGSLEEFFFNYYENKPFGSSPWPCLNAGSNHYKHLVINDLTISHCLDTKLPVGNFACDCGFIYSRRGPDTNEDDKYFYGRIKKFGPVWESSLKELVENQKLAVREVAKRLKVDDKTVKKYAGRLSLDAAWDTGDKSLELSNTVNKDLDLLKQKEKYRIAWKKLQEDYPGLSKTSLRKLQPATYSWLYKNDSKWLNNNSPVKQTKKGNSCRVNWQERDMDVLEMVKELSDELLENEGKPERITISKLGKKLDILAILEKHLDKMPLTNKYLSEVTESVEEFQVRRVKWAAEKLREDDEEIKEWKIKKVAGLRKNCSDIVVEAINEEVRKI